MPVQVDWLMTLTLGAAGHPDLRRKTPTSNGANPEGYDVLGVPNRAASWLRERTSSLA